MEVRKDNFSAKTEGTNVWIYKDGQEMWVGHIEIAKPLSSEAELSEVLEKWRESFSEKNLATYLKTKGVPPKKGGSVSIDR